MNCAGGTGWNSARSLSRVPRWMRASRRRSHHSSAPAAVKAPRITAPSASSCSKAGSTASPLMPSGAPSASAVTGPSSSRRPRRISRSASSRAGRSAETGVYGRGQRCVREHRLQLVQALCRDVKRAPSACAAGDAALLRERLDELRERRFVDGEEAVHHQRIVQFLGVADLGPGVLAHLRDHLRIELADVLRRLQVHAAAACSRPWCAAPRPRRRRGRRRGAHSGWHATAARATPGRAW